MNMTRYSAYKPSGIAWLGEVPKHWEVKKFKYWLKSVAGGGTPSTDNPAYWNGTIPWVSPKDMKSDTNRGNGRLHYGVGNARVCNKFNPDPQYFDCCALRHLKAHISGGG